MAAVPSAPNITGPSGIQSSGAVTITWVAAPEGADSYNVAVYDWYNETWPLPSTNTGGCFYCVVGLMDNHGFIICVQAINADGPGPLAYSYFDVCSSQAAPADKPVFTAPRPLTDAAPANPLAVTFTWAHVAEAGRYWLCVSEWYNTYWTTAFAVIVPDTGPGEPISYGPYTFLEGHYYSAVLLSSNPFGQGLYSDFLFFGVSTATGGPDAPTLTELAEEYCNGPIPLTLTQFEWSSTLKTLGYYFVLEDEDTNTEVGAWWRFDPGTGVPISFILPSEITLVAGHLYWFGVAGWNPWGFGTWASVTFVAPAPLTVTADAQSKFYGADNPELTFTCSGLVNGDTADEVLTGGLSTTATAGSAVGTYPITQGSLAATGYYYIGTFNGASLTVIPDTTPPAIGIWYPNNGVFLLGTVSIGGEITDSGSGVNWSTLSVTLNGMEYGASHGDSFFWCEPSYLADGVYTLAVSVYDNAYNHTTAYSTFTLDTTPPTVTITSPPDGSLTRTLPTVTGHAGDALSGVNWSTFCVTTNGNASAGTVTHDSNGNFSFQFANGLADDYYGIAVNVEDIAGNPAQAAHTTFTLDTVVPSVSPIAPADQSWTTSARPAISANVSDLGSGIYYISLQLGSTMVSFTPPAYPPTHSYVPTYTPDYDLAEGQHTVQVWAYDWAGNEGYSTWTFTKTVIEVQDPATQTFRPLREAIVASTSPTFLIPGYHSIQTTMRVLTEREVANGFSQDVTSHSSYSTQYGGTIVDLSTTPVGALPYTLQLWEGNTEVSEVDFLLYHDLNFQGEQIVFHHPADMTTETTDDGSFITFRSGTLLVLANGSANDGTLSQYLSDKQLVPTGIIRSVGLIIARPRFPETSLLHQAAVLNLAGGTGIRGVSVDFYQGDDGIWAETTEHIPPVLLGNYDAADASWDDHLYKYYWHLFVTRTLPAVTFVQNFGPYGPPPPPDIPLIGIIEAAYGEKPWTHPEIGVHPARCLRCTGFGQSYDPNTQRYFVESPIPLGDGNLGGMLLSVPKADRGPDLVEIPNWGKRWSTELDHGLGVLTIMAGDGSAVTAAPGRDGPAAGKCFVLGPAFDLRVRPIGLGGWTISHVIAGFEEMAKDEDVRVVNYSSSHWAVSGQKTNQVITRLWHVQSASA